VHIIGETETLWESPTYLSVAKEVALSPKLETLRERPTYLSAAKEVALSPTL
jgi:hypothetical protein